MAEQCLNNMIKDIIKITARKLADEYGFDYEEAIVLLSNKFKIELNSNHNSNNKMAMSTEQLQEICANQDNNTEEQHSNNIETSINSDETSITSDENINNIVDKKQIDRLQEIADIMQAVGPDIILHWNMFCDIANSNINNKKRIRDVDVWWEDIVGKSIRSIAISNKFPNFISFYYRPDHVETTNDCHIGVDAKAVKNCDSDSKKHKAHLGINQNTLKDASIDFITDRTRQQYTEKNRSLFKGEVPPYYEKKPVLTYLVKLCYDKSINTNNQYVKHSEDNKLKIYIYCIPHIETINKYKNILKRGGDKSRNQELRLEYLNDDLIKEIIL